MKKVEENKATTAHTKKTISTDSPKEKKHKTKTAEEKNSSSPAVEEKIQSHKHVEKETHAHKEAHTHKEVVTHKEIPAHKETDSHKDVATHKETATHKTATHKEAPVAKPAKQKDAIQSEINIGMIGHVDHGKTSLTKALTGKWCDTHSEEMKRGISIRLGYADINFYKLKTDSGIVYANKPEYNGKQAEVVSVRNVSFVDAPGHETLMTTMLSGAALMNGAVLVIAANEACPQPRTVEHLMALKFAGVDKVVVAQNKVDLITKEAAILNHKAIRAFLDSHGYKDAPIIPTAANFGANIDSLIEAIETHIPTPHFDTSKPLKMFIARSFDINKPGTHVKDLKGAIIGGSIAQGVINIGDELELGPGLEGFTKTKVLSIATDSGMLHSAKPGGLIAVGTDLDPSMGQNDRLRGQIAAKVGTLPKPVKELQLQLHMFERMLDPNMKDKTVIKVTEPLVITIGTNTAVGFVVKADPKKCSVNLKTEVIAEKNEKVAVSKNIAGQWRLVAYGEVM